MAISRGNQSWIHVLVDGRAISFVQRDITNHVDACTMWREQICLSQVSAKQPWYKSLEVKERANILATHCVACLIMPAFFYSCARERIASCAVVSLYHLADLANNASSITPSTL
jgi:hypothetical protein